MFNLFVSKMIRTAVIGIFLACLLGADALSLCLRYCGEETTKFTCATNGQTSKLFKNECELKNAECTDQVLWTTTKLADCLVASPIIKLPGGPIYEIPEKPVYARAVPNCAMACAMIYKPVCGFDGNTYRTFGNSCEMGVENCVRTSNFMTVEPEKCNLVSIDLMLV